MPTIEEHLGLPSVSIEEHSRQLRIRLGEQLGGRRAIYLDTRFWIELRKAVAGLGAPVWSELLRVLRDGVIRKRLFCSISETTFFEIIKQQDRTSRRATAALIDELSLGVTLVGQQERIATEISHMFHDKSGRTMLPPTEASGLVETLFCYRRILSREHRL